MMKKKQELIPTPVVLGNIVDVVPKLGTSVEDITAKIAKLGTIDTATKAGAVGAALKAVKQVRKEIDAHYSAMKRPIIAAGKVIEGFRKAMVTPWTQAEAALTAMWQEWLDLDEVRQIAEQEIIEAKALTEARERRDATVKNLRKAAAATTSGTQRSSLRSQASALATAPVQAVETALEPSFELDVGLADYSRPIVVVDDLGLLVLAVQQDLIPLECVRPDMAALNRLAERLGEEFNVPGCHVDQKRVTAG